MKKFIIILAIILLAVFFGLHFVAANQAEKEIDKAIQAQVQSSPASVSVQYSSIDVSPFTGKIRMEDVTLIEDTNIERASSVTVDLGYFDFLNLYVEDIKTGLQEVSRGNVELLDISFVDRRTMQEFSADTVQAKYRGNLWDALQSIFSDRPTQFRHSVQLWGANGRYKKPSSSIGNFTADSLYARLDLPVGSEDWRHDGAHDIMLTGATWAPPSSFQNQYGFFIRGFGFPVNAIPIDSIGTIYSLSNSHTLKLTKGVIGTPLFNARFNGTIQSDSTWSSGVFAPLRISLTDLSNQFTSVLSNMEQLLGMSVPGKTADGEIRFHLVGPVSSPRMQPAD